MQLSSWSQCWIQNHKQAKENKPLVDAEIWLRHALGVVQQLDRSSAHNKYI